MQEPEKEEEKMDNHNACESAWLNGYKQGRESVEKSGPIDVAIVVRCKDCKWGIGFTNAFGVSGFKCDLFCADLSPDDFCSLAERKDNG